MRQDVLNLISQIDDLTKQLDQLRASCPHASFSVLPYSHRVGAIQPQRICKDCGGVVPGLTAEEETLFWSGFFRL